MTEVEHAPVDVSPTQDGGVLKTIITPAADDARTPETGDEVRVHYTGTLLDGTKFDSSRDRDDAFTFTLGKHQVINAWDVGVATMKIGERAKFECRADYAYGDRGSPPTIPANATLVFDVELLSFDSHRDLCKDGGVMKEDVTTATGFATPKGRDEVTVTYDVKTRDGESEIAAEQSMTCGIDQLPCKGMQVAVKKMKAGEKVRLTMTSEYAAGLPGAASADGAVVTFSLDVIHTVEDVTGVDGAVKKILVDGEGYEKPNDGAQCEIEYEKRASKGGEVEETKSLQVVIGDEHISDELESAIMMMKLKEKALVTMADGTEYTVTLAKMERAKEQYAMNATEKLEAAEKYKASGNDAYKNSKFARATKKYAAALKFVEYDTNFSDEEKQVSKKLKLSLNLNSAAVAIKTKSWSSARKSSEKALELESGNEKALYRLAQASMELDEYDESRRCLKKILEVDEAHAEAQRMMNRLKALEARQAKKDARIFGGMFNKMDLYDDVKVDAKTEAEKEETFVTEMEEQAKTEAPPMDQPLAPDAGEPMSLQHA